MAVLLEGKAEFNADENAFLDHVSSPQFPWYAGMATKNFPCLTHNIMLRTDKQTEGEPWSPHYEEGKRLFLRLCESNGISVNTIYRIAFNLTFADPSKHGDPHNDHAEFSHKIMIVYLTKFDAGETYIFDEAGGNIIGTIKPEKDKFVVFDGGMHAQGFCRPQQFRMVLVATFDGEITPKVAA
jgi:hypothetical protein